MEFKFNALKFGIQPFFYYSLRIVDNEPFTKVFTFFLKDEYQILIVVTYGQANRGWPAVLNELIKFLKNL
jgi:hypothetical protein